MPKITEKGGHGNAIGVEDGRKIWVFERVSANCPPINRERGDNCRGVASRRRSEAMARQGAPLRRKKESLRTATRKMKKFILGYWIVNIESMGTPCEDTRPTGLAQIVAGRVSSHGAYCCLTVHGVSIF